MNNKELHEQITATVTERVDEQQARKKADETIEYAPQSAAAYELELKAKTVIHSAAEAEAGDALLQQGEDRSATADSAQNESTATTAKRSREPWIDRWCDFILAPANIGLAVGLLIFGGYFLLRPERNAADSLLSDLPDKVETPARIVPKGPVNLFNLASLNFESILAKEFPLQESTADKEELKKFYTDNDVPFAVAFPVNGKLVGGSVSGGGSDAVAHQIYSLGESIAYSMQTPRAALTSGKQAYLTPDMLKRLDAGEHISEEPGANQSLLMFKRGDIVCAVIANISRDRLASIVATQ